MPPSLKQQLRFKYKHCGLIYCNKYVFKPRFLHLSVNKISSSWRKLIPGSINRKVTANKSADRLYIMYLSVQCRGDHSWQYPLLIVHFLDGQNSAEPVAFGQTKLCYPSAWNHSSEEWLTELKNSLPGNEAWFSWKKSLILLLMRSTVKIKLLWFYTIAKYSVK